MSTEKYSPQNWPFAVVLMSFMQTVSIYCCKIAVVDDATAAAVVIAVVVVAVVANALVEKMYCKARILNVNSVNVSFSFLKGVEGTENI